MTAYETSPVKRKRRSRDEVNAAIAALANIVLAQRPMTIRQLYYRAVSAGLIDKTEQAYKGVCRLMAEARRIEVVRYADIVDNTRFMRKPDTFRGIANVLENTARFYRRDLWSNADEYVEIWCEKDALSGVIYNVTAEFDVPLMISRGFASLSFLHGAAESIAAEGKPATIYYLGDHDPSGVFIPQKIEQSLREFAPGVDLTFTRLAVTPAQIAHYGLPTRPTKKTDSRAKTFEGESVEVDAIEPAELRRLVRDAIESHIDPKRLADLRQIEREERAALRMLAADYTGGDE